MIKATKDKNGIVSLDGKICPFRTPVLIPSQLGGIELHQSSCNSLCTHFHYVNEDDQHNVIVTCGTGVNIPINLNTKTNLL